MPDDRLHDELDDYLRGAGPLSREYQRNASPLPPQTLDRSVLAAAQSLANSRRFDKSQRLAPLAFAASVFLSLAVVLAMVFAPQSAKKTDAKARVLQVRVYKSEAPRAAVTSVRERDPGIWLQDITALRRNGRALEAEVEMRRFRSAYPNYVIPINE